MNLRETYTKHRRLIIIGLVCLALAVLLWFVFRKVKVWESKNNAERELIIRQREAAEQALETRDSLARAKEDSLIMELLGIRTRVEYKIIERERYVIQFIETASIRRKFEYVDSVVGPK